MRNRFFFIILATLVFSAIGINFVHVYFFKNQRLKLIDKQISEASTALLNSRDFRLSVNSAKLIEDAISKELKGARIGKVFVVRNSDANIIYESFNVSLLQTNLPIHPEWVAVSTENEYVRIRNLTIPAKKPFVLQVGLVLDRNFLNWEILDTQVIKYVSGVVVLIFLASVLLTLLLLSPLRLLIAHLKEATSNLTNLKDVRPLSKSLTRYTHGFWARSDEFSSLLNTVQKLIDRINLNYKLTRSWSSQMAHELKTPLAIIRLETEANKKGKHLPEPYSRGVLEEVQHMTEIITQFLDWAELENSQVQKNLHALRMMSVVKNVALRLEKMSPGRIKLIFDADFSVFANPIHLEQLITNLLTNAIKFSAESEKVEVSLSNKILIVRDNGPGLPQEVVERMGQPFNVGSNQVRGVSGNGLGLAWVSTVVKLYNWSFDIESNGSGTVAVIHFNEEEQ